jgi:hypothetical protein
MQHVITLLTVLFVGLKLGGSITWSWWWVLSPLWIGIPLYILLAFILGISVVMINEALK